MKKTNANRRSRAFTLIEVLVVVAIVGLLISILLPSLARVRRQSLRTACTSNLHQIGVAMLTYRQQNRERFPVAGSMTAPFLITDDPPLYLALKREIPRTAGVYACPGDAGYVHARSGISYLYDTNLSGKTPDQLWQKRVAGLSLRDIPVSFDFDGATTQLYSAASPGTPVGEITVPFFHLNRNLLCADGHVEVFKATTAAGAPPP